MLVRDLISKEVTVLYQKDTLGRAISLLKQTRFEALPVVNLENKLIGIFTRSHLYKALLAGENLEQTIEDLFNTSVVTVDSEEPLDKVNEITRQSAVGIGVVVDAENHVIGMFTKLDLIHALYNKADQLTAELQAMLDSLHNGVIALDKEGRISLINATVCRLLDITEGDLIGQHYHTIFANLDLSSVLAGKGVQVGVKQNVLQRVLVVNASPVKVRDVTTGAMIVFQDLTELEEVGAELQVVKGLHNTLNTVLEVAFDGIVVVNNEGMVTLSNRALGELVGLEPHQIIGKHISEVLVNSRLHIVAQTGISELSDIQEINGTYYAVSRMPIIENGQVIGAVGKVMFRQLDQIRALAKQMEMVENQLEFYKQELAKVQRQQYSFEHIVTVTPKMMAVKAEALQAARGVSTILLRGENGTGKEIFAQAIHFASPRRNKPFVKVNCAAIPETLLESEFFGYAPGAFTGANSSGKQGRFEMANGGTLFLDEIGDMSLVLQAKLLRVLQEREFQRVGGTKTLQVDVRVIAATNQNLEQAVEEGRFRQDLYYRLNVIPLFIPPLRERFKDILLLINVLLAKYNNIFGTAVQGITPEALRVLQTHHWPGNVRELENVVERAVNFKLKGQIDVTDLPKYIIENSTTTGQNLPADPVNYAKALTVANKRFQPGSLKVVEWELILRTLEETNGNKTKAAKLLGISRSQLYEKLRERR